MTIYYTRLFFTKQSSSSMGQNNRCTQTICDLRTRCKPIFRNLNIFNSRSVGLPSMYFSEIIKLAHKIQTFVKSTKIIIATVPEIMIIFNIPLTIEKKNLKL